MKSLRGIIDEHEKSVLKQISVTEESQTKIMVDYRSRMQAELGRLNQEITNFTMIVKAKNPTKLMQAEQRFKEFIEGADGQLEKLALPTAAVHHLEGLDKLQLLKEEILKFGRYVKSPENKTGKRTFSTYLEGVRMGVRAKITLNVNCSVTFVSV